MASDDQKMPQHDALVAPAMPEGQRSGIQSRGLQEFRDPRSLPASQAGSSARGAGNLFATAGEELALARAAGFAANQD